MLVYQIIGSHRPVIGEAERETRTPETIEYRPSSCLGRRDQSTASALATGYQAVPTLEITFRHDRPLHALAVFRRPPAGQEKVEHES